MFIYGGISETLLTSLSKPFDYFLDALLIVNLPAQDFDRKLLLFTHNYLLILKQRAKIKLRDTWFNIKPFTF